MKNPDQVPLEDTEAAQTSVDRLVPDSSIISDGESLEEQRARLKWENKNKRHEIRMKRWGNELEEMQKELNERGPSELLLKKIEAAMSHIAKEQDLLINIPGTQEGEHAEELRQAYQWFSALGTQVENKLDNN